ncbi:MAG: hypothetical protein IJ645_08675 [Ruminococcus sp.]|nr:hypothetical protein [Ruminococcus sp.]
MSQEKNYQKQATYADRKVQLKKAMNSGFYFEAIFIEYAMLEDRTESVLRHAGGIKLTDKRDQPLKLSAKINKIRSCSAFTEKYVRQRLSLDLLDKLDKWRVRRNNLVHYLMNNPTSPDELQAVAEEGYELVKTLDNKVKSVNNYFDKIRL